jgi:excisionase family DNA binding protein
MAILLIMVLSRIIQMQRKKTLTTFDVAALIDVYHKTVSNWIDNGKLKAYLTPGGHRRVKTEDLIAFLTEHKMPIPPELASGDKKKILIVDDEEMILKLVSKAILGKSRSDFYSVFTAADGFNAGKMYSEIKPDLIILDIQLPGIDGITLCNNIRTNDKGVKIIAITGYATPENKRNMLAAGADAFFPKPLDMRILAEKVDELLGATRRPQSRDVMIQ